MQELISNKELYKQLMVNEIDTIIEEDIKKFALKLIEDVPDYFFTVPASSSGKYHPQVDLGEGGLVRHSVNVKRMLDHLLTLEGYFPMTDKEHDLLRVAALFHDCMKSGSQEMYEENEHTKFLHPIYAVNFITLKSAECGFPYDDAKFISDAIASHMGQWHIGRNGDRLPKPETVAQKALHLADYLASRKGIEMEVDTSETMSKLLTITTIVE